MLEVRNDFELTEDIDIDRGRELAVDAAVHTLGSQEVCFSYRSGSLLVIDGLDGCIVRLEAGEGGLNRVCLRGLGQNNMVAVVLLLCVSPPGNF